MQKSSAKVYIGTFSVIISLMSNKQINELDQLDHQTYRPAEDNLIIQQKDGQTFRGNMQDVINTQATDLPGSIGWDWNFLDTPQDLVGYMFWDPDSTKIEDRTANSPVIARRTNSSHSDWGNDFRGLQNINWTKNINGESTGIPKSAKTLLCSAALNNCDLYAQFPQDEIFVMGQTTSFGSGNPQSYVWGFVNKSRVGNVTEGVFSIDTKPKPSNLNVKQDLEFNSYPLSFRLGFGTARASYYSRR